MSLVRRDFLGFSWRSCSFILNTLVFYVFPFLSAFFSRWSVFFPFTQFSKSTWLVFFMHLVIIFNFTVENIYSGFCQCHIQEQFPKHCLNNRYTCIYKRNPQEKKEGIDICPFVLLQVVKNIPEVPKLNVFQVILQLDL